MSPRIGFGTSVVGPVSPRETKEKEGGNEESWHDANEDGWKTICEKAKDEATVERNEEVRGSTKRNEIGSQPDRETIRSAWRAMLPGPLGEHL